MALPGKNYISPGFRECPVVRFPNGSRFGALWPGYVLFKGASVDCRMSTEA